MARRLGRQSLTCLGLCAFAACSSTATIVRPDGVAYEADILGSDAKSLRVRDVYGRELVIPARDVAEIDHPGNPHLAIGAVLVAWSAGMIIADLSQQPDPSQRSEWSGMGLAMGIPMAVTGLALGIPGWIRYGRSTRRAEAFEEANPSRPVSPPPTFYPYPYLYPYPHPYPYPYPPPRP